MMKVLLTGGSGQLGSELQKLRSYVAPSHAEMDLCDFHQVMDVVQDVQPDSILHAAAFTNTYLPDVSPPAAAACWETNVLGTRNLIQAAWQCPIIFVSTESAVHPYNFYILTKIAAELEIQRHKSKFVIARTSFRSDPFEYPKACTDMWTIADTVANIAPLINELVDTPPTNNTIYVGTGPKTVYELAVKTRPDVIPVTRAEVDHRLPEMAELLHVS